MIRICSEPEQIRAKIHANRLRRWDFCFLNHVGTVLQQVLRPVPNTYNISLLYNRRIDTIDIRHITFECKR